MSIEEENKKQDRNNYNEYRNSLIRRYWSYQKKFFPNNMELFDRSYVTDNRPPVFLKEKAENNVILNPDATKDEKFKLYNLTKIRHRLFKSMNSSQALALSIMGNLAIYNHLELLKDITDDSGTFLFDRAKVSFENFFIEYNVKHLNERHSTSIDAFFDGKYQIAIECKFTEEKVGVCSRPRYDICDGTYTHQLGRSKRCPLTEKNVKYWNNIPKLFNWQNDTDIIPCPLYKNYQLIRNILAACVRNDDNVKPKNGHSVLIYDERNPSFHKGGKIFNAIEETRQSLKYPNLLRTCSWQRITEALRDRDILTWLTEHLELKYGL